ncbi:hypothetical protein GL218_03282 [Daldinia childiae]|uniref:uncharacterized protein n=1 Tax=Daldinia childiae TaxID=326645 RepID=UPI0014486A8E|nr:uncharacterized protein GL218_03282 [Daldinia childiae]KAF3061170.1 hypothetical protein GL218_03282 [Daldinia childiae]
MSFYIRGRNTASAIAAHETGAEMALSTGAIAGIAVGGAVLLFAALAPLLLKLARKQDQRRASVFPDVAVESGDTTTNEAGPRRLRKKSFIGEQVAVMMDKDDEVGMEESRSRRSSLNVISPARTRPGSFSGGDGSARGSVDTQQGQKPRSPDKERGYDMYQHRRKTSWIDEDALHGPTVTSPKKSKQKHRRKRHHDKVNISLRYTPVHRSYTGPRTTQAPGPPLTARQNHRQISSTTRDTATEFRSKPPNN